MKNKGSIDETLRDILLSGEEEVPAGLWEGIVAGLDAAQAKKRARVVLWRRIAIGCSAAAALAVGLFFAFNRPVVDTPTEILADNSVTEASSIEIVEVTAGHSSNEATETALTAESKSTVTASNKSSGKEGDDYIKPSDSEISVVKSAPQTLTAENLMADAECQATRETVESADEIAESIIPAKTGQPAENAGESDKISVNREQENSAVKAGYSDENWDEDKDFTKKRLPMYFSISGSANANETGANRRRILKRPMIMSSPGTTSLVSQTGQCSYGIPFTVGASFRVDFTKRIGMSIGVNYTLLTNSFKGHFNKYDSEGNLTNSTESDIKNHQHYIGIPLNLYCNIFTSKHINFYASIGGELSKGVADNYRILATSYTHRQRIDGVQWAVNAGLGVEFMITRHFGIYIDPSLRYYFPGNQPASIRTAQPFQAGFELGLRTKL